MGVTPAPLPLPPPPATKTGFKKEGKGNSVLFFLVIRLGENLEAVLFFCTIWTRRDFIGVPNSPELPFSFVMKMIWTNILFRSLEIKR